MKIKPNEKDEKSTKKKRETLKPKLYTLDTETYNGLIGGLKRIAVYDGEKVTYGYTFADVEKVLDGEKDQGYHPYVYIHNIEFDIRKIPEVFRDDNVIWSKSVAIKNKLARLSCQNYTMIDSLKLLPMSLKSLSKDFNVTHGKLDLWEKVEMTYPGEFVDIVDYLDRCDKDDPLYLEYLGYDVISLYEVLENLMEISGLPLPEFVRCITTASLSRKILKSGYKGKAFMSDGQSKTDYQILCLYDYHNHQSEENFLRAAYCGGRTEVFKPMLTHPGYHYDVNSLYPYVCLGDFPVGKPQFSWSKAEAKDVFDTWMEKKKGTGFLMCSVYVPPQNIPPLPAKMGKLCFPCGLLYGVWHFEELEYAIRHCGVEITDYMQTCFYSRQYPVFRNFIQEFSELKQQADINGNRSERTFAKLLMNTSYGYTGMRRDDKTSLISLSKLDEYPSEEVLHINEELGYAEVETDVKSRYIQVQVAATVTARARLILLKALKEAERVGNVYYCDTDSIVTDHPFPDHMVDPHRLGFWALEAEPEKGIFLMPKVYTELFTTDQEQAEKRWIAGDRSGLERLDKYYSINKKFKGLTRETQNNLKYSDYTGIYQDLVEGLKESIQMERDRLVMRSVMYLHKQGQDLSKVEYRDKKLNLKNVQKRLMHYAENRTDPHFFNSLEEYQNFSFTERKPFVSL